MVFHRSLLWFILLVSLLTGCSNLKPSTQWQAAELPLKNVKSTLAIVLITESTFRKQYEAEWVLALRKQGIHVGPSYAVFDSIAAINGEALQPLALSHKIDMVLVASVSLVMNDPEIRGKNLSDYLEHQMNMGFDVFMQQVETVPVQVSAFSLNDQKLLWRSEFNVDVEGQGLDWGTVVPSTVALLTSAGLTPPPEPQNKKHGKDTDEESAKPAKEPAPLKFKP